MQTPLPWGMPIPLLHFYEALSSLLAFYQCYLNHTAAVVICAYAASRYLDIVRNCCTIPHYRTAAVCLTRQLYNTCPVPKPMLSPGPRGVAHSSNLSCFALLLQYHATRTYNCYAKLLPLLRPTTFPTAVPDYWRQLLLCHTTVRYYCTLQYFILLHPSTVPSHYTCPLTMLMLSAGSVSVMSARLAKFAGASSIQLSTAKALPEYDKNGGQKRRSRGPDCTWH